MDKKTATIIADEANKLLEHSNNLAQKLKLLALETSNNSNLQIEVYVLATCILACFLGYYIAQKSSGFLNSILITVSCAISGIVIINAMIIASPQSMSLANFVGLIAIIMTSFVIFGGFIVSYRIFRTLKNGNDDL